MKRKIISILLTVMLCFGLVLSVSSAPNVNFIVDEFGNLTDSEIAELNSLAAEIYDEHDIGVFFLYTAAETLSDYDIGPLVGDMENYFVMLENETSWYTISKGKGEDIDPATEEQLRDVYDQADTYVSGIEDFLYAAADCFPVIYDTPQGDILMAETLLYDEADLLSDNEEYEASMKLMDASEKYNAQITIVTIDSMDGGDIDEFVEYLYDSMGLGYGENHDGVLLLVCMDPREYRILSNGFAGDAIEGDEMDNIEEAIVSDLSSGNYADAFDEFIDECSYYLNGHLNGFPFDFGKNILIALAIGILAGVIVAFILKGQLKSVRKQNQANVYVKQGSMQITNSNDFFLYRTVDRREKESSSSNSSGSSGSSRNVGGGSF